MIRNLKPEKGGLFENGVFTSTSLFSGDMGISICVDDGATVEYAERCITHYNKLTENDAFMDQLEEKLTQFFLYMYEEWSAMEMDDIVDTLKPIMEGYNEGEKLLQYLSDPTMYVFREENGEIGYLVDSECPWEPEHMCSIIVREDALLYVGPSEGQDPWDDPEDYECVWEEE